MCNHVVRSYVSVRVTSPRTQNGQACGEKSGWRHDSTLHKIVDNPRLGLSEDPAAWRRWKGQKDGAERVA